MGAWPRPYPSTGRVGVWSLTDDQLLATFAAHRGDFDITFTNARTLVVAGPHVVEAYGSSGGGTSWTKSWVWKLPAVLVSALVGAGSHAFVVAPGANGTGAVYVLDAAGHEGPTIPFAGEFGADPGEIAVAPDGAHFAVTDSQAALRGPTETIAGIGTYPTTTVVDLYSSSGTLIARFSSPIGTSPILGFSADGTTLGVLTSTPVLVDGAFTDGTFALNRFVLATGKDENTPVPTNSDQSMKAIALSPRLDRVVESHRASGTGDAARDLLGIGVVGASTFAGNLDAPVAPNVLLQGLESAAFVPNGTQFLAAGGSGVIPIFAVSDTHSRLSSTSELGSSVGTESAVAALAPDGSRVVMAGSAMTVTVTWLGEPRRKPVLVQVGSTANQVSDLAFGSSPDAVALAFTDGSVELRRTSDGKRLMRFGAPEPCVSSPSSICPLGPHLSFSGTLTAGRLAEAFERTTRIWNFHNGVAVARHDFDSSDSDFFDVRLSNAGTRLVTTSFTLDGSSQAHLTMHIYDATPVGWSERRSIVGEPDSVNDVPCPCLTVATDGLRAVESSSNGLTMWNLETGRKLWAVGAPLGQLFYSTDNSLIYEVTSGGALEIISARTGSVQTTLPIVGSPAYGTLSVTDRPGHLDVLRSVTTGPLPPAFEVIDWRREHWRSGRRRVSRSQ